MGGGLESRCVVRVYGADGSVHHPHPSRNLCTEQSPKWSDDTRCCTNTIVLLRMSTIVLETCRGM